MNIDANLSVKINNGNITVLTEYQRYALEQLFSVKCKVATENDEDSCKGNWCSARNVIRRAFGQVTKDDPDVVDGSELADEQAVTANEE